jgi:chemotaxis protein CheZ
MTDLEKNAATNEIVESARELIKTLESGESTSRATVLINKINRLQEDSLYKQIGKLTRELHDALSQFQGDINIVGLGDKAPDAKGRLEFVIDLTESAANRTMDGIEKAIPISEKLAKEAARLFKEWDKFKRKEMNPEQFKVLYKDVLSYLEVVNVDTADLNAKLQDVLLAQEYQDLTGQVIKRVIRMVTEVETKLINLLAIANNAEEVIKMGMSSTQKILEGGEPVIVAELAKVTETEVAGKRFSQNEVDDLLSSLGF